MADALRIGVEVDVSPLNNLASASQSTANAIQSMAQRMVASGLSAKDAASALANLGFAVNDVNAALGLEAKAADTATASTTKMASAMGVARVEAGVLSGST